MIRQRIYGALAGFFFLLAFILLVVLLDGLVFLAAGVLEWLR